MYLLCIGLFTYCLLPCTRTEVPQDEGFGTNFPLLSELLLLLGVEVDIDVTNNETLPRSFLHWDSLAAPGNLSKAHLSEAPCGSL